MTVTVKVTVTVDVTMTVTVIVTVTVHVIISGTVNVKVDSASLSICFYLSPFLSFSVACE